MKKQVLKVAAGGAAIGLISIILTALGNPANMGFCIACFLRDTAGAMGMHSNEAVQYVRPEIIGLVLGAFIISLVTREFSSRAGSAPFTRFVLGALVMIAALVFLGCPLRMLLRIAGGDLNAIIGLGGFAAGIFTGSVFLKKGYTLKRHYKQSVLEGAAFPAAQLILLVTVCASPAIFIFSQKVPGSQHAPFIVALVAGLVGGAVCQRARLCMAGGIRDIFLLKSFALIAGPTAILITAFIGNIITGSFKLGFDMQPIAHTDGLWNFLSMVCVGLGSVLLSGCPLRQLILAGEGSADSAVTVMGLTAGAAIAHNFKLASSATIIAENGAISGGVTTGGKISIIVIIIIMLFIAAANTFKKDSAEKAGEQSTCKQNG